MDERACEGGMETDERFPSGPWTGFYQQWGLQSRQRLGLRFAGGVISGEGRDPAGHFVVKGTYDTAQGRCAMRKVYPTHVVEYDGHAEGDGIWGRWEIAYAVGSSDRGGFHIWPDATAGGEALEASKAQPEDTPARADAPAETDAPAELAQPALTGP